MEMEYSIIKLNVHIFMGSFSVSQPCADPEGDRGSGPPPPLKLTKTGFWFQYFGAVFASKGYPFKNIFDFTAAGDWDCVAAVERIPALHYSVDFFFLSFGIMGFIEELGNY